MSDDELLTLAQEGNDAAFEELMRRTSSSSFKLALSVLKDRQDAEDVVQDSYCNAWRHILQFHRDAKFSTWITRIVMNQCLMRLRKTRRARLVRLEDSSAEGRVGQLELPDRRMTPESELGSKQLSEIIRTEVARLPRLFRDILAMRYFDELSIEDVARKNGITVVAAKSRLTRARAELKLRLEKRHGISSQAVATA